LVQALVFHFRRLETEAVNRQPRTAPQWVEVDRVRACKGGARSASAQQLSGPPGNAAGRPEGRHAQSAASLKVLGKTLEMRAV